MDFGDIQSFHFVGVGGVGMSGLAEILIRSGHQVSGSDLKESRSLLDLRSLGVRIFIGHNSANLGQAQAVVYSSAVPHENPELIAARDLGLPILHRGRMLAELIRFKKAICVCGTHGKTTTTSIIATLLLDAGLDPTVLIGAKLESIGSNARLGQGEWAVAEADESDRSFLMLSPLWSVVTNIDNDHMDEYQDLEDLQKSFLEYMHRVPFHGRVVACLDDSRLADLLKKVHRPVITYGIESTADIRARGLQLGWLKSGCDCYEHGQLLGHIELAIPGRHNVLNCLAAVAVGRALSIPFELIQRSFGAFRGVERRLQWKGEKDGVWVVDDYAHHPAEIQASLQTCKTAGRRTVVVFQPHRYSRTQHLMKEMSRCFADANLLYLMDIYPAGEEPVAGVSSSALAQEISRYRPVNHLSNRENLLESLGKETETGDLLVTLGAGNVWEIGEEFLERTI